MYATIRLPLAALLCQLIFALLPQGMEANPGPRPVPFHRISGTIAEKYQRWGMAEQGLPPQVFASAMKGYYRLLERGELANPEFITIIDFSRPSAEKRLHVIDLRSGTVMYHTLVAHGRNSGKTMARRFSNRASSLSSSPGFYITGATYTGKHGYSLRLDGCEKGWNDRAKERAIVVHGADYVSEAFIRRHGFLGRSHGCPALPETLSSAIIDLIRDGSCLFIYAPDQQYLRRSELLN